MATRREAFTLRTRLLFASLGLVLISALATEAFLIPRFSSALRDQIRADLVFRAGLIADRVAGPAATDDSAGGRDADLARWDALADRLGGVAGGRVTLIASDGRVLGDSHVALPTLPSVENHATRAEVREALGGRVGSATRLSETVGERMLYVAAPWGGPRGADSAGADAAAGGGAVRIGVSLGEVEKATNAARRLLLGGALFGIAAAAIRSSLAARWISGPIEELARIAERIDRGDLSTRIRTGGGRELSRLGRTLEALVEDQTRVSEERRRERDLLSAILEGMREGILVLDGARRILSANSTLRGFFAAEPDLAGRTTLEAFRCLPLEEALTRGLSARDGFDCEFEVQGPPRLVLLAHVRRISAASEAPLLAVLHDVTDLRRLETIRRDFVASASHELRTPVAAIRGSAEALEEEDLGLSPEAHVFAEIVRRHSEQLSHLVDDLLDLSRIESGAFRPATERIDARAVLEGAAGAFEEAARRRGMRLAVAVEAGIPALLADRRALEQVLHNLVDNATKYAREGAVVTLRARADAPGAPAGAAPAAPSAAAMDAIGPPRAPLLTLSVEDDGPGIEERHLPRLFERFYRVEVSRSRALGGTGLGLAIVKHLVEAMGGTVSVDSAVGRGTTFRVTLLAAR
jgi:two-component system phosphate regulon sensor histidine kinase PhoR